MRTYYDECGRTVQAGSYQEAAELLYGSRLCIQNSVLVTKVERCSGYAKVYTHNPHSAGIETSAAKKPVRHILRVKYTCIDARN